MKIVYDEVKRGSNLQKHGLDFAEVDLLFFSHSIIREAKASRMKAIGMLGGRLVSVIFLRLGREGLSIVSLRPASRYERELFYET